MRAWADALKRASPGAFGGDYGRIAFRGADPATDSNETEERDMSMEFQKEVDASGLNCPLPILRAKKALAEMQSGEVLHIIATDPGSGRDFSAFAKQTGNELLDTREDGKTFHFWMRRR